jgi:hypothetical protein
LKSPIAFKPGKYRIFFSCATERAFRSAEIALAGGGDAAPAAGIAPENISVK